MWRWTCWQWLRLSYCWWWWWSRWQLGIWDVGRHWLVTVTGVTLKHCIEVLQSSYNLCATSAIVSDDHNSEICLLNTTFCKAWQSATPENWTWILWWGSWSWWRSCLGGTSTMVVMWWRWKWYWWQRWGCLWLWWWCDGRDNEDVGDNHSDDDDGRDDDWQSQVSAAPPVWAEKCTRPFAGTQWTTLRKVFLEKRCISRG